MVRLSTTLVERAGAFTALASPIRNSRVGQLFGSTVSDVKKLPKLRKDIRNYGQAIAHTSVEYNTARLKGLKTANRWVKDADKLRTAVGPLKKEYRNVIGRHLARAGLIGTGVAALGYGIKAYQARRAQGRITPQHRQFDVYPEHGYGAHGATQWRQHYYTDEMGGREIPMRAGPPRLSESLMRRSYISEMDSADRKHVQRVRRINQDPKAKKKYDKNKKYNPSLKRDSALMGLAGATYGVGHQLSKTADKHLGQLSHNANVRRLHKIVQPKYRSHLPKLKLSSPKYKRNMAKGAIAGAVIGTAAGAGLHRLEKHLLKDKKTNRIAQKSQRHTASWKADPARRLSSRVKRGKAKLSKFKRRLMKEAILETYLAKEYKYHRREIDKHPKLKKAYQARVSSGRNQPGPARSAGSGLLGGMLAGTVASVPLSGGLAAVPLAVAGGTVGAAGGAVKGAVDKIRYNRSKKFRDKYDTKVKLSAARHVMRNKRRLMKEAILEALLPDTI